MKPPPFHFLLAAITAYSFATAAAQEPSPSATVPAAPALAEPAAADKEQKADKPSKDPSAKKGKKKKKNKNKDGSKKDDTKKDAADKDAVKTPKSPADSKDASAELGMIAEKPADKAANGNWCEWLASSPGTFLDDKSKPWLQFFRIGGRFNYQASYQDGSDVNDRDFHDTFDEYRRFRIETRTRFLQYFTVDLDVNLVDDRRFRNPPNNDLDWGYDAFETATLEFNLGKAFGTGPFDKVKLKYGSMKMPISEEQRQSSRSIYTIERSMNANKLRGDEGHPTGLMLTLEKDDWRGSLAIFSGEDDADFIGGWNDGQIYYASLIWQPDADFNLSLDYVANQRSGVDDALGYRSAVVLGTTYDKRRWGIQASVCYGDNGYGDLTDKPANRLKRQGDFYGMTVMPWYWLVEKKLQLVFRYEYAGAQKSEGLRLPNRYLRGHHNDPLVDLGGGRGDEYQSAYLGLNYYFCGDNLKVMGGILYEDLATPSGGLDAFTYTIAFRTSF